MTVTQRVIASCGPVHFAVQHGHDPAVRLARVFVWWKQVVWHVTDADADFQSPGRFLFRRLAVAVRTGRRRVHAVAVDLPRWWPWPRPLPLAVTPRDQP